MDSDASYELDGKYYYSMENNLNKTLRRSINMNNQEVIIEEIPNLENLEIRTPVVIEPVKYTMFEKTSINNYFQDVKDVKEQLKNLKVDLESKDKKLDELNIKLDSKDKKIENLKTDHSDKIFALKTEFEKRSKNHVEDISFLLETEVIVSIGDLIKHAFGTEFISQKNKDNHLKKNKEKIDNSKFDNNVNEFISYMSDYDKNSLKEFVKKLSKTPSNSPSENFKTIALNIIDVRNNGIAHAISYEQLTNKIKSVAGIFDRYPQIKANHADLYLIVKYKDEFLKSFFKK